MKPLAERTAPLKQSGIRAITTLVNEHNAINLGQGICDMPAPDPIKQGAIAAIENDRSIYTSYAGIRPLREAIFEKCRTFNGIPMESSDEVMASAGSTGAFVTAMMTLLEPGDEVILFEPFYGYHRNLLRLTGATQTVVTLNKPDWAVDFEALEQAITPRTKAIVVCTPANPTGKVWTRNELEQLLALLVKHDLYAVTDEIYEYMTYEGRPHVSLASLPGAYERTITLSGFSKTFNMTGWRLGYAVAPPPIIEKMGLLNDLYYICAPTPLQHGLVEGFRMGEEYFSELLAAYEAKRALFCDTLEDAGFLLDRPQGAYYVLADFSPLAERLGVADDWEMCETLIREAGVGSIPGRAFFQHPEDGRHLLRFCYAKELPVLEEACGRLATFASRA
ncbi:MAG: pyridoxal phosphate-dependent aminotransferase [Bacteroidota bacterium]